MDKSTLLRYKGYRATPSLFKTNVLPGFDCIKIHSCPDFDFNPEAFKNQRLGKLVEEFVFFGLKQQNEIHWIAENLQIQRNKYTIGEIDALYLWKGQAIHLEVVYKFYLYDTLQSYTDPLDYWIGPNRKDTLQYKIEKLRQKQLPLLFKPETRDQLARYNLQVESIAQNICFKAQLFVPYNNDNVHTAPLNPDCISGYHIAFKDLAILKNSYFYIPKKLDWLAAPHHDVDWCSFSLAKSHIEEHIKAHRSPMVWLKHNTGQFEKCFVTFW